MPIAIETEINTKLSIDKDDTEAKPSMPVKLVAKGDRNMQINRLMLLVMTEGTSSTSSPHETDDPIELEVTTSDGIAVKFEIPDTPQLDLERGQANLYSIPVSVPFSKRSLNRDSIVLRIKGSDRWLPSKLFLFGLDDAMGRPEAIVPLVHIPNWTLDSLSSDSSEGEEQVTLPLVVERLTTSIDTVSS